MRLQKTSSSALYSPMLVPFLILLQCCTQYNVLVRGQVTSDCISNINDMEAAELLVTDFSIVRTYTLCPSTTYNIGLQDYFGEIRYETGSDMIHLRPNLHIQCGATGERTNNCMITGGTVQVDGTAFFINSTSTTLSNVMLSGLTFTNALEHNIWIDQPGTVVIRDCVFQDLTDINIPILLDYFDALVPETALAVTIQQCDFTDYLYKGQPAQAALIVGNSKQNHLVITDSNFLRNDVVFNNTFYERASFLIETGGPLNMTRSCFQHNRIGVSPVVVYSSSLSTSDNFQYNSTGAVCQLSAFFTASSYEAFTPICASFDAASCMALVGDVNTTTPPPIATPAPTTDAPIMAPISTPNTTATNSPSASPNVTETQPTVTPSVPTDASPIVPTVAPSPTLPTIPNVTVPTPISVNGNDTNTNSSPGLSPTVDIQFNATSMATKQFYSMSTYITCLYGLFVMAWFSL